MRRLIIDVALFVIFIAELSFYYLPKYLHEVLGVAMAVIILVHFAINGRRFIGQFSKLTPRRFLSIEVDIALGLCALVILLTGLCMSNHLFPDLASYLVRRNMTIHSLHKSAPYIMLVLIGMHIGLHWREIFQKVSRRLRAEQFFRCWKNFFKAMILILAAFGALGLYLNNFLDRILMKHIFATPATNLPAPMFIFLLIGGVILFAVITSVVAEKFLEE